MLISPLLDFVVIVSIGVVLYVGFGLTPFSSDFDWYAYRLGLDRTVARSSWAVGLAGLYVAGQLAGDDTGLAWVLLLLVSILGLFYLSVAVSNRPRADAVTTAAEGGVVESTVVDGSVRAADDTLTTPYADREAVCFHAVVTQERGTGRSLVHRRSDRTRFVVDDGPDETTVDPADGRLFLDGGETLATPLGRADDDPTTELTIEPGERPSDAVGRALSEHAGIDVDGPLDHETRIREYTLEPGDQAVVVGEGGDDGARRGGVRTPFDRRSAVVAGSLDAVADNLGRTGRHLRVGVGLVAVGFGGALALGAL